MIEVRTHEDFAGLDLAQMERLNARSRRASPFASPFWLTRFVAHDSDLRESGARPLFLAAYEGTRLVGYLPLRSRETRLGRVLGCLTTLEVARPQAVAEPADEGRVAQAFWRFLLHRADEWALVELVQQEPASALYAGPDAPLSRHWLRRIADRTNNLIPLEGLEPKDYVRGLSKGMRSNLRAQAGRLLDDAAVSLVYARAGPSRERLFEVFLEVERRSWKARAAATMAAREGTYRAVLAEPRSPLDVTVGVVCRAGLPIAASVWAHFGRVTHYLQTAYTEASEELGPGTLATWWPIADALARGSQALDMLPDFSAYKARWGARTVATETVQLFRVGSLLHLKACAGDFARRVRPAAPHASSGLKNPTRVAAGAAPPGLVSVAAGQGERGAELLAEALAAGAVELDPDGRRRLREPIG